jgi:hypothetical protein
LASSSGTSVCAPMENEMEKTARKIKKKVILFFNTTKFPVDYLSLLIFAQI